jgi:hypothetical protein
MQAASSSNFQFLGVNVIKASVLSAEAAHSHQFKVRR